MSLATLGGNRVIALLAGLFVLLGAVVIAGWLYFQVVQPGRRADYFVLLPDVSGLRPGTEVKVAGYPVGEISSITPELENIDEVEFRVDFIMDKLWPIPVDSTVTVESDDLFSGPTLVLYPGNTDTLLSEGARILTAEAPPGLTEQASRMLEDEVTPALRAMTATLDGVRGQLEHNVPEILRETRLILAATGEALAMLRPQIEPLAAGLGDAGALMSRVGDDETAEKVEAILADLNRFSTNLDSASRRLADVVESSEQLLKTGDRLLADSQEPLSNTLQDSEFTMRSVATSINLVLRNLERASQDLAGLIADIRANPSVLVRGSGSDGRNPFR